MTQPRSAQPAQPAQSPPQAPPVQKLFTRNFTFLVLGQVSSLLGNMTLRFALSMFVLEVTGSASIFAGLLSVAMIPTILLSPLGGILADRVNRRNIMVTLDLLSGLAVLVTFFSMRSWPDSNITIIGALMIVLSVLGAFESPTVQACVPQMLSEENILRGNAVVNQVAAVSSLITPFAGSLFYVSFGIKSVLLVTVCCFFLTAILECFIQLAPPRALEKRDKKASLLSIIKDDFAGSIRFLHKDEPQVLQILLLAAVVNLLLTGLITVGFPFMVRNVLELSATLYGAAESALGIAAVAGSLLAGVLSQKLSYRSLYTMTCLLGFCLIPPGICWLLPISAFAKYAILTLSFCVGDVICVVFSIFAMAAIQTRTPSSMTGKIMAYSSTISMCAQPLSQMLYGLLFDAFHSHVAFILLVASLLIVAVGKMAARLFHKATD